MYRPIRSRIDVLQVFRRRNCLEPLGPMLVQCYWGGELSPDLHRRVCAVPAGRVLTWPVDLRRQRIAFTPLWAHVTDDSALLLADAAALGTRDARAPTPSRLHLSGGPSRQKGFDILRALSKGLQHPCQLGQRCPSPSTLRLRGSKRRTRRPLVRLAPPLAAPPGAAGCAPLGTCTVRASP